MTRVISLSDEAYAALKALKEQGDSFSKVVLRLAAGARRRPLSSFAGIWKDRPDIDEAFAKAAEWRASARFREVGL